MSALRDYGNGVSARYAHLAVWDGSALTLAQVQEHAARFHGRYTGQ